MFHDVPSLFTVIAPLAGIMLSSLAEMPITWQVYFDINKAIVAVGSEAGYPPVERAIKMRQP